MTIYNIESVDKKIFKQGGKRTSKVSNLQKFIQERKKGFASNTFTNVEIFTRPPPDILRNVRYPVSQASVC